jgi:hypothetical protein
MPPPDHSNGQIPPKQDSKPSEIAHPDAQCRLCMESGELPMVSPCNCTGSQEYIHLHCLRSWQKHCLGNLSAAVITSAQRQTHHRQASVCSVCKMTFTLPPINDDGLPLLTPPRPTWAQLAREIFSPGCLRILVFCCWCCCWGFVGMICYPLPPHYYEQNYNGLLKQASTCTLGVGSSISSACPTPSPAPSALSFAAQETVLLSCGSTLDNEPALRQLPVGALVWVECLSPVQVSTRVSHCS